MITIKVGPGQVVVVCPGREPYICRSFPEAWKLVIDLSEAIRLAWPGKDKEVTL